MTEVTEVRENDVLNDAAFWVLAVLAVAAGAMVFRFDSMARATFSLLTSLLCVAGEVLLLGLDYLGIVIVLMMTIEMAIMAVFMIMYMMNPAGLMPMTMMHNKEGAAVSVPLFLGGGHGPLLPGWTWTLLKTAAVLALLVWARRRVPGVRMERYVELAWVVLTPLAVVQALVVALVVLNR